MAEHDVLLGGLHSRRHRGTFQQVGFVYLSSLAIQAPRFSRILSRDQRRWDYPLIPGQE